MEMRVYESWKDGSPGTRKDLSLRRDEWAEVFFGAYGEDLRT
jgi:hypothetical protein